MKIMPTLLLLGCLYPATALSAGPGSKGKWKISRSVLNPRVALRKLRYNITRKKVRARIKTKSTERGSMLFHGQVVRVKDVPNKVTYTNFNGKRVTQDFRADKLVDRKGGNLKNFKGFNGRYYNGLKIHKIGRHKVAIGVTETKTEIITRRGTLRSTWDSARLLPQLRGIVAYRKNTAEGYSIVSPKTGEPVSYKVQGHKGKTSTETRTTYRRIYTAGKAVVAETREGHVIIDPRTLTPTGRYFSSPIRKGDHGLQVHHNGVQRTLSSDGMSLGRYGL